MIFSAIANQPSYPFILPELPYSDNSFGILLSKEAFDYHHKKHHNAYVVNLNNLLESKPDLQSKDLESIVQISSKDANLTAVFNNAAQVWNHSFFWHSMQNGGAMEPTGKLLEQIKKDFGGLEQFKEEFKRVGAGQFGSGWVWLVWDEAKLKILGTSNAFTPITTSLMPLITCDVWEHAYYIDYRNRRPDYLTCFVDQLINWKFAEENFNKFSHY